MIQLGHVKGNKMVDMQLSNDKLVDRGIRMIMTELNINAVDAQKLINKYGNVRSAKVRISKYRDSSVMSCGAKVVERPIVKLILLRSVDEL